MNGWGKGVVRSMDNIQTILMVDRQTRYVTESKDKLSMDLTLLNFSDCVHTPTLSMGLYEREGLGLG